MNPVTLQDLLPDVDVAQASAHLEALHRGASGYLSLVMLKPPRQERHCFTAAKDLTRVGGLDAYDSRCELYDVVTNRWNVYTACSTFRAVPEKGRGTHSMVDSVPGVWADLDVKPGVEGYFQTERELDQYVAKLAYPPTLEVASGSGGRHLYWLTKDRMTPTDATKILPAWLDYLRSAGEGVVIENVMDSTRILRLAGTVRWPKVNDPQASQPMPVSLIKHDGPRYALAELKLASTYAANEAQSLRDQQRAARKKEDDEKRKMYREGGLNPDVATRFQSEYNRRADWADLLLPLGWTLFADQRDSAARCRYWVRPGKHANDGKSASTDYVNDDGSLSSVMTIYTLDPSLLPLWENLGTSDSHGICSKWNFALKLIWNDDEIALMRSVKAQLLSGEL